MITIEVYRRPSKVDDKELKQILKKLPSLVSKTLHSQTYKLTRGEDYIKESRVRVLVHDFGPLDLNIKDLEISIRARNYPRIRQNIHERKETITHGVKKIINEIIADRKTLPSYITCEIELNLIPSSFGIIEPRWGLKNLIFYFQRLTT